MKGCAKEKDVWRIARFNMKRDVYNRGGGMSVGVTAEGKRCE